MPLSSEDEIKKLVDRLDDADCPEEVIKALVSYGKRALLPVLEAFQFPTTRYMAGNAGQVLVTIGQPAVAPLIELLRQNKSAIDAAWTLGFLGDWSAVEPLIIASTHKSMWVRSAVVHSLGVLGDARATNALVKRLRDRSSMVRFSAVLALKEMGDVSAIEPLRIIANNPKSPAGTKIEALAAIVEIESRMSAGQV